MAHSAKCDRDGCNEPTPWDMASIQFADHEFCSPNCAREAFESLTVRSGTVTLHDPQFAVDRDTLPPAVEGDDVNIERRVYGNEEAKEAIDEIEMLYPREFRVTQDNRTNIKVYGETKVRLDAVKRDGETWDECLTRLVQLDRATQVPTDEAAADE